MGKRPVVNNLKKFKNFQFRNKRFFLNFNLDRFSTKKVKDCLKIDISTDCRRIAFVLIFHQTLLTWAFHHHRQHSWGFFSGWATLIGAGEKFWYWRDPSKEKNVSQSSPGGRWLEIATIFRHQRLAGPCLNISCQMESRVKSANRGCDLNSWRETFGKSWGWTKVLLLQKRPL